THCVFWYKQETTPSIVHAITDRLAKGSRVAGTTVQGRGTQADSSIE
ncbi:hypothetical protein FOQG_18897, partial [Fusarium oxysporum f. sp. raphani 54005]